MSGIDWAVMLSTIGLIVAYGVWKTRGPQTADAYIRGGNTLKWPAIGLSIMATQASAITFMSTPGVAFERGMGFVQFYLGLPIAMVVISAIIVPIYYRQRVFTAYEYLEGRFDLKTRLLGASLFLISRGLAVGISIYAPAIVLSTLFGWQLETLVIALGGIVIVYTVSGGTRAVTQTQKQQMIVMMGGMIVAAVVVVMRLPDAVSLDDALAVAGSLGRMEIIDPTFDLGNRYTLWSGLLGGFFLALSYFGTDQSQVQRYLGGRSVTESRLGLLFNGILKIPMQLLILFVGVMVFVFYQFSAPPVHFNQAYVAAVYETAHADDYRALEDDFGVAFVDKQQHIQALLTARAEGDEPAVEAASAALKASEAKLEAIRGDAKRVMQLALGKNERETKDSDYIFISFVVGHLPIGLIGLLMAVILSAAMSSTASELNALGTTTVVDFYKRLGRGTPTDRQLVVATKGFTIMWGLVAIGFASFASVLDNLIEAVNILGSLFYGTVLGIFLVAFFIKRVGGTAVFAGALCAQAVVLGLFFGTDLAYLWFNVVGCACVIVFASIAQLVVPAPQR